MPLRIAILLTGALSAVAVVAALAIFVWKPDGPASTPQPISTPQPEGPTSTPQPEGPHSNYLAFKWLEKACLEVQPTAAGDSSSVFFRGDVLWETTKTHYAEGVYRSLTARYTPSGVLTGQREDISIANTGFPLGDNLEQPPRSYSNEPLLDSRPTRTTYTRWAGPDRQWSEWNVTVFVDFLRSEDSDVEDSCYYDEVDWPNDYFTYHGEETINGVATKKFTTRTNFASWDYWVSLENRRTVRTAIHYIYTGRGDTEITTYSGWNEPNTVSTPTAAIYPTPTPTNRIIGPTKPPLTPSREGR